MENLLPKIIESLIVIAIQSFVLQILVSYFKFSTSKLIDKCRKVYSTYSGKILVFMVMFLLSMYIIHIISNRESATFVNAASLATFEYIIFVASCCILGIAFILDLLIMSRRKTFAKTMESYEYKRWLVDTLRTIYPGWQVVGGDDKEEGVEYASCILNIKEDFKWVAEGLDENIGDNLILPYTDASLKCEKEYLDKNNQKIAKRKFLKRYAFFDFSLGFRAFIYRVQYYLLVRNTVRFPDLIGYALDEFIYEGSDPMTITINGVNCSLTTYFHNVMTSHIMEYELYRAYLKHPNSVAELDELPYRKSVHRTVYKKLHPKSDEEPKLISEDMTKAVFTMGCGRYSLLSVQALIVYKESNTYKTFMYNRGDKVAIYKNHKQIAPAGGFELYERSRKVFSLDSIRAGFDPEYALAREVLEELFGIEDFDGNSEDQKCALVRDTVYAQGPIKVLKNESNKYDGQYWCQLCTNTLDVVYLRHVLSYIIVINHCDFYKDFTNDGYKLNLNEREFDRRNDMPISKLSNIFQKHNMSLPDTAGLVRYFLDSDIRKALEECEHSNKDVKFEEVLNRIKQSKMN